jgi:hypothetical protein
MSTRKILRRILWSFYAIPITLLLLPSDFMMIYQYGPGMFPFATFDCLISLPSLVAMYLHIWDKQLFVPAFWKIYAFIFIAWDFSFNLLIEPAITGEELSWPDLIGAVTLVPLYVAVFRYAFRKWDENGVPPKINAD